MALQYDYTKVANHSKFNDLDHKDASRFAWVLAAVDMNEITKSNVDEIAFRLKFAEQCGENFLVGSLSIGSLKAFIRSYIGYKTNVRTETRKAYIRKIMRMVENKTTELFEKKSLNNMADDKVHQQLFGI
jgi:fructose/tagatose bisphosphate aldolase